MIYSAYAYTDNEEIAFKNNEAIYKELKKNSKVKYELNKTRAFYDEYHILSNPDNLSNEELALLISGNGLHFGFAVNGDYIKIYTD